MSKWMANLHRLSQHYDKVLDLRPKGIESGVWKDYTHWGNHGTIANATEVGTPAGTGFKFNGTNTEIDCGNKLSLNPTKTITIEAWIKKGTNSGTADFIVGKDEYIASSLKGYNLFISTTTDYIYWRLGDGTAAHTITLDYANYYYKWVHIVGVWNGTTQRLYLNGVEVGTSVNWSGTIAYTADKNCFVGNISTYYFNGIIDEVRVYASALSAADILTLYNLGKRQRSL